MTAAPIDIPLDDRGAPDLQLLVRKLGEAAAKARGEAYDPAHNPAHAGYPRITPAIWQAFDAAMAEYQRACRAGLASAAPSNAGTRRRPPSAEFTRQRLPNHRGHELLTFKHDRIRVPAVVAPTEATAAIQSSTGALTIYRRHNKPALGPPDDFLERAVVAWPAPVHISAAGCDESRQGRRGCRCAYRSDRNRQYGENRNYCQRQE